jgi:predicted dehydrogenase
MESMSINRRSFARTSVSSMLVLSATGKASAQADASERLRVGFIGVGNRGGQVMSAFLEQADVEVVAICDVFQPHLEKTNGRLQRPVKTYTDFRKLMEHPDMDAVVIATPDHWHAIQTIAACNAGKDVYVEKPLSVTIHEGRKMVEAARRNDRVVQVGTHRRSSELYPKLAELITSDQLGKITVSRAYRLSNMFPNGMGKKNTTSPPDNLDWDMWLGPRPLRAYQDNIAPYKFRWWQQFSSQAGNWGVHYLDAIRWMTGELAPASVCAMGGRFAVEDDRTVPDTMEAVFEFASGRLAIFGQYEASGATALKQGEIELRGTQGTAYMSNQGFEIFPERGGQFQDHEPRMEPISVKSNELNSVLTSRHVRNFLDCVKSRKRPNADVEIGHRSTTMSLLANISLATGSRLEWDAKRERITNCDAANELLHYEYRKPWTLD